MGYNSTIVLMNDHLHRIAEEPNFGEIVSSAVLSHSCGLRSDAIIRIGGGTQVVGHVAAVDHADITSVIAVGGYQSTTLTQLYNGGVHSSDDEKLVLLRQLAKEMGYNLHKMKTRSPA